MGKGEEILSDKIDDKVVEMRFDNSQFEKGIQSSISSLEKLKGNLNFNNTAKGLDEISSSVEDTNGVMSVLTNSVGAVGAKFSALEVIAITALANITNSAVNTGKRLAASLSIDQISAGFSKYEQKTTAVQTIVNATGKTLEEVNEQLDKLNWFTDETSYNFTDMVGNIGKFTSMGIDLGTSVTAMMGIANWAALSGQGTNEASRAMYNLSQAIGVGAVKLQDWKSIENANMATKEFKEIAIETAKALGTLSESGETANGTLVESFNFSSTLSDGWFTSDVLLKALDKYGSYSEEVYKIASKEGLTAAEAMKLVTDETMTLGSKAFKAAQEAKTFTDAINATKDAVSTGWMNSFEIIFGNYEEAKVLWTNLANSMYDIFASGAEGRNELLSEWKELGGREKLVESFYNALTILQNVIEAVKDSFRDIFPAKTAEQLYNITDAIYNFTEKVKNNEKPLEDMKRILKGVFAVLDIGKQLLGSIFRAIKPIFGIVSTGSGGILNMTGSLGDLLVKLDEIIKRTGIFDKVFQKIANSIIYVINAIKQLSERIKRTKIFADFVSLLNKVHTALKAFIDSVKEKFSSPGFELFHSLLERIQKRLDKLGVVISFLKNIFVTAINTISSAFSTSSILKFLGSVWTIIVAIAKCITNLLGKAISSISEKLKSGDIKGTFDFINSLSFAGVAVGLIKFMKSLSETFSGVKGVFDGIGGILDGVRGCFEAYQNKLKADTLFKIASAIAILVASLFVLSLIDSEKLTTGIIAISSLFGGLMTSLSMFNKMSGKASKAVGTTALMVGMSVSILILAFALKKLASIEPDKIVTGISGVAGLMAILVVAVNAMGKKSKTVMKGAAQLVLLSIAIRILASACKSLSTLSWGEIAKGLAGVGVLLAEVAAFLNYAKFSKRSFSTAAGMVLLALAIKILGSACKTFAKMDWKDIGKGLTAIGALLLELTIFSKLVNPNKMMSTGIGMIAIATAIRILASAMHSLSSLSWSEIGRGLTVMAGSLFAVIKALNFLPENMISKAVGLLGVSTAIFILSLALRSLGKMSLGATIKGLIALGGSMAILSIGLNMMEGTLSGSAALLVAALALAVLVPSIALLGKLSWKTIAKGLITLALALAIIGGAAVVLAPLVPVMLGLSAAMALLGVGLLGLSVGILLFSAALTGLAAAGLATAASISTALNIILLGFASLIPSILVLLAQGIIEFAKTIGEGAPVILSAVESILLNLLSMLWNVAPVLMNTVGYLLVCALQTLVAYTPQIVQALFDILIAALEGIVSNIGRVVQTAIDVVIAFTQGVASKIPDVVQAGFDLVISFIYGLAYAIEKNSPRLVDAISTLCKAIINAAITFFKGAVGNFLDCGKNIITGLIDGIKGGIDKVKETISSVGNSIKNWFCSLLGINSPSKVFYSYGGYIDDGLANGIRAYSGKVKSATDNLGDMVVDDMANAISKISDTMKNGEFCEPTIRPVLDLSEIQNGTGQINKMMSEMDNYGINGSFNMAQNVAKGMQSKSLNAESYNMSELAKSIEKMSQNQPNNIENTFNITGSNPKEIAEEVSKIIDKQVRRRDEAWG